MEEVNVDARISGVGCVAVCVAGCFVDGLAPLDFVASTAYQF